MPRYGSNIPNPYETDGCNRVFREANDNEEIADRQDELVPILYENNSRNYVFCKPNFDDRLEECCSNGDKQSRKPGRGIQRGSPRLHGNRAIGEVCEVVIEDALVEEEVFA